MTIELTREDADFILKYIRDDLTRINQNLDNIDVSYKKFKDSITEDVEKKPEFAAINAVMHKMKNIVNENSRAICQDLERCVELLTMGSEK